MENSTLVLIDIQNIYFMPGEYQLYEPEKAANNAGQLLKLYRQMHWPIVHVRHRFRLQDCDAREFSMLNDFYTEVVPLSGERVIYKDFPNAFQDTELLEYLRSIETKKLVVAGMMTYMCVETTVRACQLYDYHVSVVGDACATKALSWQGKDIPAETVQAVYLAGLTGMFAKIVTTKDVIDSIARR